MTISLFSWAIKRACLIDAEPKSGLSILVVDDYPDAAASMAILLSMQGHRVRTATDGEEALRLLTAEAAQVILLDIGLPRMDGYAVARRIRLLNLRPRPIIIAIT